MRRTTRTDDRPSAGKRGYGAMWRKCRAMQLAREPVCRLCHADGVLASATEVDHIKPLTNGGAHYDHANLQSLCHPCHAKKTWGDQRSLGRGIT